MDYGSLIRDAWTLTWRYRFLWILGLFTGTAVGSFSSLGGNSIQWQQPPPAGMPPRVEIDQTARAIEQWIALHQVVVGLAVLALVVLFFALLAVSLIAQGGMTEATVDLARQQPIT